MTVIASHNNGRIKVSYSRCCPGSNALSPHLHGHQIAFTLPFPSFLQALASSCTDATLLASDFPVVSSPFAWWYTYHLTFPCTLRKVRDSNPRVAVEQLRSYVYAALPCCCLSSQPTFLFFYCSRILSSNISSHGVFLAHSTFFFNFMQKRPLTPLSALSHCLHLSVILQPLYISDSQSLQMRTASESCS